MTRALFVTSASNEMYQPLEAWRDYMGEAGHITFQIHGRKNDASILACAEGYKPEIIIFSGANDGEGLPEISTLKSLRGMAPTVHYQGDFEDEEWWPRLQEYRDNQCFDLVVAQTGVSVQPYSDYATVTAISPKPFEECSMPLRYRCGFAGSHSPPEMYEHLKEKGLWIHPRSELLYQLRDKINLRQREVDGLYLNYIRFIKSHQLCLNSSWTGSGRHHHLKGRVIECAWAGRCLLEHVDSPTKDWIPEKYFIPYIHAGDLRGIINFTGKAEIREKSEGLREYCLRRYHPRIIYRDMINRLGIRFTEPKIA